MGASDNWMAGLAGAAAAGQDIVGLLLGSKIRERERRNLLKDELELYRQKLPLQTAEDVRQKQLTSDIDFKRALALLPYQTESRKEVAASYPNVLVDEEGNPIRTIRGRGTKIGEYTEEKKDKEINAKLKKEFPKAKGSYEKAILEYDRAITQAKSIRNDKKLSGATGLLGGRMELSRGQRRIDANLDTLKAQVMIRVLGSLKELSATGASGFGALNTQEGDALRNSIANMKRTQDTEDFESNFDILIADLESSKDIVDRTFKRTFEDFLGGEDGADLLDISRKAA